MKYIVIPEDVGVFVDPNGNTIIDSTTNLPMRRTFKEFALDRLCDDTFGRNMGNILMAVEIKAQIKKADKFIALEDAHYKTLREITKNPSPGRTYSGVVAQNLVPYIHAVLDASSVRPEVEASDETPPDNGASLNGMVD